MIPAYNEESRLPGTLDLLESFLSSRSWSFLEVIVVDDGSTDSTAALVGTRAASWNTLRLLRNPGNHGKGYAVRQGMLNARGVWILSTDADLSAPIEEVDKLFAAVEQGGVEVAIGSRAVDRSLVSVHQSALRELSGRLFNLVMRQIAGLPFRDTQCGFKLFHRDAARRIFPLQTLDRFGFDVEDLFIARRLGIPTVEVGVRWANVEGTKVSLASGLDAFLDLARIRLRDLRGRYRERKE